MGIEAEPTSSYRDLTLSDLEYIQAVFDAQNDNGGAKLNQPVLHTAFHISHAAHKVIQAFETYDHPDGELELSIVDCEVIPDLLVLSLMLARQRGVNLGDAYANRLQVLAVRNGQPDSAEIAFLSVLSSGSTNEDS